MLRVGMLTSGGDCQALNAAMRGVAKTLYNLAEDVMIYGFTDGYRGLVRGEYRQMKPDNFSGILNVGGTILGTSRMPYKFIDVALEDGTDKIEAMVANYRKLELDCLVVLGGNGSHKTALRLKEEGLNIVTLPKTIDNDLAQTQVSFGFQSAVDIAANAIDCIHTTAASHSRVFIVEIMGHKTGWLALHAGLAGGADVILIPEVPYDVNIVAEAVKQRAAAGRRFTIIAMAEGALSVEETQMSRKDLKMFRKTDRYPSASYRLGSILEQLTGQEVRVTVPGHVQRGGSPVPFDRVIATRLGVEAARLILDKKYGYMVRVDGDSISYVELEKVAGRTRTVDVDDAILRQTEDLGICLGR